MRTHNFKTLTERISRYADTILFKEQPGTFSWIVENWVDHMPMSYPRRDPYRDFIDMNFIRKHMSWLEKLVKSEDRLNLFQTVTKRLN